MRMWPALDVSRLTAPDLLQAALLDFAVTAVDERSRDTWRVFFNNTDERNRACHALGLDFPELSFAPADVPDEQWAERAQADLRAVAIGRLVVAPPWDLPSRGSSAIAITIQPSMGFGTGHHATTRLCLLALQRLDLRGRSVIDVGTGSGVLALAAAYLGATRVVGIDDDPDAIRSAGESLALNFDVEVDFSVSDLRTMAGPSFGVVLANLTGGLLVQSAGRLQSLADLDGTLILSGFLEHEETDVRSAFASCELVARDQEEGWVGVTLVKRTRVGATD